MKKMFLLLMLLALSKSAMAGLDDADKAVKRGDYVRAIQEWQQVSQTGEDWEKPYAEFDIAEAYEKGMGVRQDYAVALYWYVKAAQQHGKEKGDMTASFRAGVYYYEGRPGVERNIEKARSFWIESGRRGYVASINAMKEIFGEKVYP